MDKIIIRDLSIRTIIGIFPEERKEKQDVIINIELNCELRQPGRSDNLNDTIDYKKIKKKILNLVENAEFHLLEALADAIANVCLAEKGIKSTNITVDKPGALRFARSVAVQVTRP